jgi:hypothetical protein
MRRVYLPVLLGKTLEPAFRSLSNQVGGSPLGRARHRIHHLLLASWRRRGAAQCGYWLYIVDIDKTSERPCIVQKVRLSHVRVHRRTM